MSKSFRALKDEIIGGKASGASDDQTPFGVADGSIAESSRRMQRFGGQPISSNDPSPARADIYPAFSCEIAPGPNGDRPIKSGPAYEEGKRAGTQISHSPGKNDQGDVGRKRVVTY
jgi:hypothetical protein